MRIGELSERTGVSRRSLRYWEQQGLLVSERLPNGYREYGASAQVTVETIRSLLGIGLPTSVIRQLLPCTGAQGPQPEVCPGLLEWIARIRDDLDEKVTHLTANRDALTRYLRTAAQEGGVAVRGSAAVGVAAEGTAAEAQGAAGRRPAGRNAAEADAPEGSLARAR